MQRSDIGTPPSQRARSRGGWGARLTGATLALAVALPLAAALVLPAPRHAAQRVPSPPWQSLRIGVEPAAMALVSDTRLYTEEGHELVLARALGERLGVAPQFIALAPAAFAAALSRGEVDAVLTRAPPPQADTGGLETLRTGYRSGTSAALRSDTALRRWEDLRGRTVCVTRAHGRAQDIARRVGARITLVDAPAQGLTQVRTGACDAALHDDAQLQALFLRKEWHKFSATLPAEAPAELVLLATRARPAALKDLRRVLAEERRPQAWASRNATWAANVAYEVYFDQIGPDCH